MEVSSAFVQFSLQLQATFTQAHLQMLLTAQERMVAVRHWSPPTTNGKLARQKTAQLLRSERD